MRNFNAETQKIISKLNKVKALHDRATTDGERRAAQRTLCHLAIKALKHTLSEAQNIRPYQFQELS